MLKYKSPQNNSLTGGGDFDRSLALLGFIPTANDERDFRVMGADDCLDDLALHSLKS